MGFFGKINCLTTVHVFKEYEIHKYDAINDINPDWFTPFKEHSSAMYQSALEDARAGQGKPGAIILPTSEAITSYFDNEKLKSYNPLDRPDLYTDLAKLDTDNDDKLLRFLRMYGLPIGLYNHDLLREPWKEREILSTMLFFHCNRDHLAFGIANLKDILLLWEAIENNNQEFQHIMIRKYANLILDKKVGFDLNNGDVTEIPKNLLIHLIGFQRFDRQVTRRIVNKKIKPVVLFEHLFQVAYYQLDQAIISEHPLRRCEQCGELFEVKHGNQRFCPPLTALRSTCENNHSSKVKRRLKKELLKGE